MKKLFFLLIWSCLFSSTSQAQLYFNKDDSTFTSKTEVVAHYDSSTETFVVDRIHRTQKVISNIDTTKTESLAIVHSGNSKRFKMDWIPYEISRLKEGIKDTIRIEDFDNKQSGVFTESWTKSYLCAIKEGNTIYLSTVDKHLTALLEGAFWFYSIFVLTIYVMARFFLKLYKEAYHHGKVNFAEDLLAIPIVVLFFAWFMTMGIYEFFEITPLAIMSIFLWGIGIILRIGLFFPKLIRRLNKNKSIKEKTN